MSQSADDKEFECWFDDLWIDEILSGLIRKRVYYMPRACSGIVAGDYLVETGMVNREDILGGTVSRYTWNG